MNTAPSPKNNPVFRKGYIGYSNNAEIKKYTHNWAKHSFAHLTFEFHPATIWASTESKNRRAGVLFIGNPVDIDGDIVDGNEIAKKTISLLINAGLQEAVRFIAYLGGRFVAHISFEDKYYVIPDCHATYATFWTQHYGPTIIGSHAALIAKAIRAVPDRTAIDIMHSPDYVDAGGKYYPACLTPFEGIKPVIANCMLVLDKSSDVAEHTRFYPWPSATSRQDSSSAKKEFNSLLEKHVELLFKFGKISVGLTGGLDSRTTILASRKPFKPNDSAYTYMRFEDTGKEMLSDLLEANSLAYRLNIQHRILKLSPYNPKSKFNIEYNESFRNSSRFPALAQCYFENMDPDEYSLLSTIAETGTVFYTERNTEAVNPSRLAEKFSYSAINKDESLINAFREYMSYTDFYQNRFAHFDYHDLFYWEHRNSKWAAQWYAEIDMSHGVLLAFNQRRIIETMLDLPLEERLNRDILNDYIHANEPK